jgi:peptidyl-prolyl cis-trans isomerase A (cyclophilin A)
MRHLSALLLILPLLGSACSQGASDKDSTSTANGVAADAGAAATAEAKPPEQLPDTVRVRLDTEAGPVTLALDAKHAPITTANFLHYVDTHRYDGMTFYRAARTKGNEKEGFIQGGIRRNYRLMYAPIAHEPTSKTGLHHVAGTISMARSDASGVGAMGDFFIITHAMPDMDAHGDKPGYAAFGKVTDGMATVRKILAAPTAKGGSGAMKGQMIEKPVRIEKAVRVE